MVSLAQPRIHLRVPLPPLGAYTVGADFVQLLIEEVWRLRPRVILEAGSGVSTVIAAYCLEKLGCGSLYALEHLEPYGCETRTMLQSHGLENIDVHVLHAPLRSYEIGREQFVWYATDQTEQLRDIDMVVVDGPPRTVGRLARYPLLPLFANRLSPGALILMDDASRPDEKEIIDRWQREFPGVSVQRVATRKGAALLRIEPGERHD